MESRAVREGGIYFVDGIKLLDAFRRRELLCGGWEGHA
jgi:hypothetical protein